MLTYFSFIEPWSYTDSENYFTTLESRIKNDEQWSDEVYFHRELLGYSKERRFMELITITGKNDMTEKQEPRLDGPGLFPAIEPGTREAELF